MDTSWNDVSVFLAVAETGSFSAAARRLGLGQPTVSRRVAQLEEHVGSALFRRGVEGAMLTQAGHRLVPAATRMAESAGEWARLLESGDAAPTGRVRIAAPPGIAFDFLAPLARHVFDIQPALRLEVLSSISYVDLARHEADLAIRMRLPTQRELTWIAEMRVPAVAYAVPEVIAHLPPHATAKDVDWITWAPPYQNLPPRPQLEALIEDFDPVFTSDSYLVQLSAAEAGVGAIFLDPRAHRFAPKTRLVPLPFQFDYTGTTYLVCAKSMLLVPRVRAVIDILLTELQKAEQMEVVINEAALVA